MFRSSLLEISWGAVRSAVTSSGLGNRLVRNREELDRKRGSGNRPLGSTLYEVTLYERDLETEPEGIAKPGLTWRKPGMATDSQYFSPDVSPGTPVVQKAHRSPELERHTARPHRPPFRPMTTGSRLQIPDDRSPWRPT